MRSAQELTCRELVELVTDYLEHALPADERARFEEHLEGCGPCVEYIGQMRRTVELVGTLREDAIAPAAEQALLAAFRDWRAG